MNVPILILRIIGWAALGGLMIAFPFIRPHAIWKQMVAFMAESFDISIIAAAWSMDAILAITVIVVLVLLIGPDNLKHLGD